MPPDDDDDDLLAPPNDEIDLDTIIPPAAHEITLPEQHIVGANPNRDLDEHDWLTDFLSSSVPTAASRSARRLGRVVDETIEHPLDAVTGAVSGAFQGTLPYFAGLATALDPFAGEVGLDPDDVEHASRQAVADAAERSPHAHDAGDMAGSLAGGALIPEAPLAEGTSAIVRAGVRGLEGAGLNGASAALASDAPDVEGMLRDAAEPAALGFALGSGVSGIDSAVRSGTRAATQAGPAWQRDADLARISSVLGERRAPITDREMQDLLQTLGRGSADPVHAAAERVRETGIVRPFATVDDVAERARAATRRAEEPLHALRSEFEASGGRVPVEAVPDALEGFAGELDRDIGRRRYSGAPRDEAREWREVGNETARVEPDADALAEAEGRLAGSRFALGEAPPPTALAQVRDALRQAREGTRVLQTEATPIPDGTEGTVRGSRPSRGIGEGTPPQADQTRADLRLDDVQPSPADDVLMRERLSDAVDDAYRQMLQAQRARRTIPLSQAERALRDLDRGITWTSPTGAQVELPTEVAQDQRRVIRDSLDDIVGEHMGGDSRERFPADRRAYQTRRVIRDMSERRAARARARSPLASAIPMVGTLLDGGAGAATAVAGGVLGRMARAREASALATGSELVARVLQRGRPEALGQWAEPLMRAAQRGPQALAVMHHVLETSEPDYARRVAAVEHASESGGGAGDAQDDPYAEFEAEDPFAEFGDPVVE